LGFSYGLWCNRFLDSWICKAILYGFISSLQAVNKLGPHCESCGLSLPSKRAKKLKHDSQQLFCRHCTKVCKCAILIGFQTEFLWSLVTYRCYMTSTCKTFLWLYLLLNLQLLKSKQYCGICKKIWHHTDGGSWVRASTLWVNMFHDFTSSQIPIAIVILASIVLIFLHQIRFVAMDVKFGFMQNATKYALTFRYSVDI